MAGEFVVIDTFRHAADAETARAVLEMEGIKAFVEDGSIEGVLGIAPEGVQLARTLDMDFRTVRHSRALRQRRS